MRIGLGVGGTRRRQYTRMSPLKTGGLFAVLLSPP